MPRSHSGTLPLTMADLDRLWAPWRSEFVSQRRRPGCVFCAAKRAKAHRQRYVVARGERVFALLNRYPYNNGHLLIAPYRHVGRFESLTAAEWAGMFQLCRRLLHRLRRLLRPHGFNLGMNLERAAGAGIPGHLHLHVVPRWHGDTNFMPVAAGTRVVSQSLDELHALLTAAQQRTS